MKMSKALSIIATGEMEPGFMVHFERREDGLLVTDYFPDKHAGEPLIATEEEAWELAQKFAAATVGRCVNVYVVRSSFAPVKDYLFRRIKNRSSRYGFPE